MVLCWQLAENQPVWRYNDLAVALSISASEAHKSVRRLIGAKLLSQTHSKNLGRLASDFRLAISATREFLVHGVKYAFYPERGPIVRGMPTGIAAPAFRAQFSISSEFPVWPDELGEARGYALKPLYPTAAAASRNNPGLYALLAAIDALRDGRARERKVGERKIDELISAYSQ